MNFDQEYYVLERENNEDHFLLTWDDATTVSVDFFSIVQPVELEKGQKVIFTMDRPKPETPVLADHHAFPDPAISKKIKEALAPNAWGVSIHSSLNSLR